MPELHRRFSIDAKGSSNKVEGLTTVWDAIAGGSVVVATQRLERIRALLAEAAEPVRVDVVRVFGRLARERSATATAVYETSVARRDVEISVLEAEHRRAKDEKQAIFKDALMAAGAAIGALAVLGLFLALLAIERNTRAVQEIVRSSTRAPQD